MSVKLDAFQVPLGTHLFSGFVHRTRALWIGLGNLETLSLRPSLEAIGIDRPVYVTGIARAGTTILLEFLAGHANVVTHKYRDFPGVFVPTWWEQGYSARNRSVPTPQERAHGDGLEVTANSPEAIEECLWMAFFPRAHRPGSSSVLDASDEHPRFERFYRDHIRKLLFVRGGRRYVAKGNYNFTRLGYLQRLFPDARFVVAVRHPRSHVASLIKQHRLFCKGETRYPRALRYMQRVGHYEFGLDRRPINTGNSAGVEDILSLWQQGEEVRGWARYWARVYGWLADELRTDTALENAVEIIRFEDLCDSAYATLERVLSHCELDDGRLLTSFAKRIQAPQYYEPSFSGEEELILADETGEVAQRFGYPAVETSAGTIEPRRIGQQVSSSLDCR